MDNSPNQKTMDVNAVFGKKFLNSQSLYLYQFGRLPSVHFMNGLDGEKAYNAFKSAFADLIEHEHHYRWYDKKKKRFQFDETFFILKNRCVVEMKDYCEILHDGSEPVPTFLETIMLPLHQTRKCGRNWTRTSTVTAST